jgi:phosphoesterase RecJ-like protein
MSVDWKRLKSLIDRAKTVHITSHVRPDCDALGSALGLAAILRKLGKTVRIINAQPTPPNLAFIDPDREILVLGEGISAADAVKADLWIIADTSAWAQLGSVGDVLRQFEGTRIVLDHHVGEDDLGAELFKDITAEATGRLVAELATYLQVPLTPEISTALFAALATDTGWFRFPSASAETYRVAARLIDTGASPAELYGNLYERETAGRVRLRGVVLSRIRTELDGRLAHTWILRDDYAATGALPTDTEDLVNHCLEIDGTEFAVILIEQPNGGFKISFRSRCAAECNQIAQRYGGGGHKAAAGAFIRGSFAEVQPPLLEHVRQSLLALDGIPAVP